MGSIFYFYHDLVRSVSHYTSTLLCYDCGTNCTKYLVFFVTYLIYVIIYTRKNVEVVRASCLTRNPTDLGVLL